MSLTKEDVHLRVLQQSQQPELKYLPPYSPDLNPIENLWSQLKSHLRRLAPRTADELLQAATAFAAVSPSDCHGFFSHAGYATCLA